MRKRKVEPFRVLVADCPWPFKDKLPGAGRGASKHYRLQKMADIYNMPLPPLADDAILFLWKVAAMPYEALDVLSEWDFKPKAELVWIKTAPDGIVVHGPSETVGLSFGMGRYVRASHETCLIATRGKASSLIKDHGVRSVFFAPRGAHSEKPNAFYDIVEKLVPGPYAELYSRRDRPGWTAWGDELGRGRWHPGDEESACRS